MKPDVPNELRCGTVLISATEGIQKIELVRGSVGERLLAQTLFAAVPLGISSVSLAMLLEQLRSRNSVISTVLESRVANISLTAKPYR